MYLKNYNNIILDFDGVIINTNQKKEENIYSALQNYKEKIPFEKCLAYFNQNPGIGRKEKLKKFIADKIILDQILNDYKKENYKMAERYEAAGSALFINVIKNGKETHIDLTDFAFMNAFNDEKFAKELKTKIDKQLKTL